MIKYNNNTINDWFFSTDNIIKVYRNNAICYYKIDSSSPSGQTPCYAVVEDISQYSDTEFEDVFNMADGKWYKLNNLDEYEEYGVYASGRTSCEGSSRLPQGYTEVEYIRNSNYNAYIDTGVVLFDNTTNTYNITTKLTSEFHSNLGCATIIACENPISTPNYYGLGYRYKCSSTVDQLEFYGASPNYSASVIDNGDDTRDVIFQSTGNTSWTLNTPLIFFANWSSTAYTSTVRPADATIYSSTVIKNGDTVRDFVPAKRDSDSVYGLYDLITDTFYTSPNGNNFSGGEPITPTDCVTTYEGKLTIDDGDDGDGEDYSTHYLSLVAQTDNVTFSYSTATSSNKLQYSVDSGSTWVDLGNNQSTSSINNGEKIMFKASGLTVNTERGIGKIIPSASASVEGNIMSLAYDDNFSGQTEIPNNFQFRKLFSGVTTITSAENMVLPATTIKKQCYSQMFQGCTSLTTAPTVIGSSAMTWSGDYCWSDMFNTCTSLVNPPKLPALNLGAQCYWYMFQNCSSLTRAPELLATTTATQCYNGMFSGCISLNYIKVLASSGFSMNEWVKNVGNTGTFVKSSAATFSSCGQNTYPCGWTVQDYVEPTPIKYEYIYSGGSWVNVGEVSGSTYIEYLERDSSHNGYVPLGEYFQTNTRIQIDFQMTQAKGNAIIGDYGSNDSDDWRVFLNYDSQVNNWLVYDFTNSRNYYNTGDWSKRFNIEIGNYYIKDLDSGNYLINTTAKTSFSRPNQMYLFHMDGTQNTNNIDYGRIYSLKIWQNDVLVKDYIPWTDGNGNYGLYDNVSSSVTQSIGSMTGATSGTIEYPIYYDEMQDPPNNLSFSSMTEAESYECPWVGMQATIDGAPYVFSGDSTSGYEWVKKLTAWYTLQDLINTHTVVSLGNNRYNFSPEVNGISYFRVHTDKVSGSNTYVDLYNDNLPSPPYFGIKDDSNITLYTSVDGYSNLKSAADSTSCTWAYWIDANTIEVNAQAIMNDTMKIGFYNGSFSKLLLSFELPII